jgi:hypothetical protein
MLLVSGAPAEIPSKGIAGIVFSRVAVPVQQGFGCAHEARCAVSALESIVVYVCLNNRMARFGYTLGRFDLGAIAFTGQGQARQNGLSVHDDRTGAAGAKTAAPVFRRGKADFIAQKLAESPVRLDGKPVGIAVDRKSYRTGFLHLNGDCGLIRLCRGFTLRHRGRSGCGYRTYSRHAHRESGVSEEIAAGDVPGPFFDFSRFFRF